jgi:hypothetical protein
MLKLKLYFNLLIIILALIHFISTDCPDRLLYCFNRKEELLGDIQVNQCWTWSRVSCQPCSATTNQKKITYEKYIHQCRHYYPASIKILIWDNTEFLKLIWRIRLIRL